MKETHIFVKFQSTKDKEEVENIKFLKRGGKWGYKNIRIKTNGIAIPQGSTRIYHSFEGNTILKLQYNAQLNYVYSAPLNHIITSDLLVTSGLVLSISLSTVTRSIQVVFVFVFHYRLCLMCMEFFISVSVFMSNDFYFYVSKIPLHKFADFYTSGA